MKKLLLALLSFTALHTQAQSSAGPNDPSSHGNTSCAFSYSSALHIAPASGTAASDDQYASAAHCDCCDANTTCLEAYGYNFAIPTSATITGIEVDVERHADAGSIIQDNGLRLLKAGSTTGIDHMSSANWPAADTYASYGGPSDLWGASWTPADINDPGFGLAMAAISYTCSGFGVPASSYIDHIRITVYYNLTTGIFAAASDGEVSIYPQPFDGRLLSISGLKSATANVTCYDLLGKSLLATQVQSGTGLLMLQFSERLAPGTYVLAIEESGMITRKKIVVH